MWKFSLLHPCICRIQRSYQVIRIMISWQRRTNQFNFETVYTGVLAPPHQKRTQHHLFQWQNILIEFCDSQIATLQLSSYRLSRDSLLLVCSQLTFSLAPSLTINPYWLSLWKSWISSHGLENHFLSISLLQKQLTLHYKLIYKITKRWHRAASTLNSPKS